ncbi:MAG TPA: BamA/TamA family outer membrane protein [Polyangiaceae bacterium]|nr:BamA/TamA family outer membrane protein [Polyangiaceae bacterium]
MRARRSAALSLACALFFALLARVERAKAELPTYSPFEQSVIAEELDKKQGQIEATPEGKRIESIEIARRDVLDERDPIPDIFNFFHVTTREHVIRRELLFREGQRFDWARVDETARNLRGLPQLSLVLIVPLTGSSPDRVRLLVVTKDVWSLRLNSNFQYGPEGLTYLFLNPTEWNLFGTHAMIGGLYSLRRSTYSLGLSLSHARIMGTRLAGSAALSLVFERKTSQAEGFIGVFNYGLPQYSARQRYFYGTALNLEDGIVRVSTQSAQDNQPILLSYHRERYVARTSATRSFGLVRKNDLTLGIEADRRVYRSRVPGDVDPALRSEFESKEIPVSDTRVSPYLKLTHYENRFLKTIELETLGLQEDFRLGAELQTKVYVAGQRFGSSRNLLGVFSGVSYTVALGNGLVRGLVSSSIEYADSARHQALATAALRIATPRLGPGRFILDGVVENRFYNYLRNRSALGGEGRLRGYPASDLEAKGSSSQRGSDAMAFNAEFRSRAIEILSAQCGMAAFFDMGAAAASMRQLSFRRSAGAGFRVLFPQADRLVLRLDWAVPFDDPRGKLPGAVFLTFGQAFTMPDFTN